MIRVYYLPVIVQDGTHVILGSEHIHDALVEGLEDPVMRKLIQDTTQDEHDALAQLAQIWREPLIKELELFNSREIDPPPSEGYLRACELLESSPEVITMPEMWELLRIFGRHLGYRFD